MLYDISRVETRFFSNSFFLFTNWVFVDAKPLPVQPLMPLKIIES